MEDKINWKDRYIELEEQMKQMMMLVHEKHVEKEIVIQPKIEELIHRNFEEKIEVIVIGIADKPIYLFEIIDEKTSRVVRQVSNSKKNSCIFNVSGLSDYRVKAYIKNAYDKNYTSFKISRVINPFIRVGDDNK